MAKPFQFFRQLGPGFVVAATGVGAGDLIAASVGGARFGAVILWAAVVGGVLKFVLNEGVARWQLATGTTLLEGWIQRLPRIVSWYFMAYLLLWSFVVAGALISFCGLAAHTLIPLGLEENHSVLIWGGIHSLVAATLVLTGRYRSMERLMKFFIGLMFLVVAISAILSRPDWGEVLSALLWPRLPAGREGLLLVLGIIGGVGGSVTLLCYAYWLSEKGWRGPAFMRPARTDLAVAYLLTSLFGLALIIIASGLRPAQLEGFQMIVSIANELGESSGDFGRWLFLIGFWGAVFSSMLGVWDGVPYLFADFLRHYKKGGPRHNNEKLRTTRSYHLFLAFLALPPITLAFFGKPVWVGIAYAVTGAFFMPFLAALLLYMNNRREWVHDHSNGMVTNVILVLALLFFGWLFVLNWW